MKLLLVFAICIAASSAYVRRPIATPKPKVELVQLDEIALMNELQEFIKVIDITKIIDLVIKYIQEDKEVLRHFNYLYTKDFKDSFVFMQKAPEFRELLDFFVLAGIDMYTYVNLANDILGIDHMEKEGEKDESSEEKHSDEKDSDEKHSEEKDSDEKHSEEKDSDEKHSEEKDSDEKHSEEKKTYKIGEGMPGFVADMKAAIPYEQIYALHDKKILNECVYTLYFNRMISEEFMTIVKGFFATENYRNMVKVAIKNNIDVDSVAELYRAMAVIGTRH